jgi:hypothetical protein
MLGVGVVRAAVGMDRWAGVAVAVVNLCLLAVTVISKFQNAPAAGHRAKCCLVQLCSRLPDSLPLEPSLLSLKSSQDPLQEHLALNTPEEDKHLPSRLPAHQLHVHACISSRGPNQFIHQSVHGTSVAMRPHLTRRRWSPPSWWC